MLNIYHEWPRSYNELWEMLQEFPELNFDDYGPRNIDEFSLELNRRVEAGELLFTCLLDGRPIGYVGVKEITPRLVTFHGMCFTRAVHGKGIAHEAVSMIIGEMITCGFEKISCCFFAHNQRVHRFFKRVGFEEEGLLRAHTLQGGKPVDMRMMALLRKAG